MKRLGANAAGSRFKVVKWRMRNSLSCYIQSSMLGALRGMKLDKKVAASLKIERISRTL